LGAWACGRLMVHGASFVVAALVAIVVTTATGVVIALMSTRTRGVSLAVLTFGVAVCIVELVLTNPAITGGLEGTHIVGLSVFGFALGAGIAALGGIMVAFRQHTLALSSFSVIQSIQSLLLTCLGGIGYVLGAVDGALLAPGGIASQILNADNLEQQRSLDII